MVFLDFVPEDTKRHNHTAKKVMMMIVMIVMVIMMKINNRNDDIKSFDFIELYKMILTVTRTIVIININPFYR